MIPARMCLESLDRRPGIREQPGSNSEVRACNLAVRFTLKNGRRQWGLTGPKSAKTRLLGPLSGVDEGLCAG